MEAPAKGAVVLVRFPFSDLSRTKLRPAVVLADAGRGDRVLCQVHKQAIQRPHGRGAGRDRVRVRLVARYELRQTGEVVHGEQSDLITAEVGALKREAVTRIVDAVVTLLRAAASGSQP